MLRSLVLGSPNLSQRYVRTFTTVVGCFICSEQKKKLIYAAFIKFYVLRYMRYGTSAVNPDSIQTILKESLIYCR